MSSPPMSTKTIMINYLCGNRTPRTILRNINGKYYGRNYEKIKNSHISDHLKKHPGDYIIKPSIDSSGAKMYLKYKLMNKNMYEWTINIS